MALTNADFRSIIKIGGNLNELNDFSFDKKKKLDKKPIENDTKREKQQKEDDDKEISKYKDRAEERRICKDDFYKQVAEEYREMNERSIEESKYLGGDTEHTHLVKGLDFALLSKVRSELEELKKEAENQYLKTKQENKRKETISFHTTNGRQLYNILFQHLHPHHLSFQDKLRHMDSVILKGLKFKGNTDIFLPGRTCYLFDIRMEMNGEDIPTILFNSRLDCPKNDMGIIYPSSSNIVKNLSDVLKWHSINKKRRKQDRLPRRPGSNSHKISSSNKESFITENKPMDGLSLEEDNIYSGIEPFNPDEIIHNTSDNILPTSYDKEVMKISHVHTQNSSHHQLYDYDFNNRYKMDIIRDEQGMEVDDDIPQIPNQNFQSSYFPTTSAVDLNSSYTGTYTSHIYEEPQFDPQAQDYYYNLSQGLDTKATPFVTTDTARVHKSGMTTTEQDRGFHSVYKRDEVALRKRGDEDEREKDPAYISDTYMECYPGFGADVSYEVYDSDDDEDRSKMDMGRLKQYGAKRRDDFANREDWEQYQLEKEALPKAAFQYGRKMDDNRVTRRKKKLNADEEWKKIEKMMGDKNKSDKSSTIDLK